MKGQIESKETFMKYVVRFVSTLKRHQYLLPQSLVLWMWPGAWGHRVQQCIPVPGGRLGAPRLLGMPFNGSAAVPGLH